MIPYPHDIKMSIGLSKNVICTRKMKNTKKVNEVEYGSQKEAGQSWFHQKCSLLWSAKRLLVIYSFVIMNRLFKYIKTGSTSIMDFTTVPVVHKDHWVCNLVLRSKVMNVKGPVILRPGVVDRYRNLMINQPITNKYYTHRSEQVDNFNKAFVSKLQLYMPS